MWTRKNLKEKAKKAFKANYWKTVFVTLVIAALVGGAGYGGISLIPRLVVGSATDNSGGYQESAYDRTLNTEGISQKELDALVGEIDSSTAESLEPYLNDTAENGSGQESIDELPPAVTEAIDQAETEQAPVKVTTFGAALLSMIGIFALVIIALAIAIRAFLLNPVSVGGARFSLLNLNQQAKVRELAYAYDHNYRETVKTLFFRDLFTLLWSLLLIVPGIVKAYEYRMIPYLLAEDPTMTKDRAFAESKAMMTGNKWRAFVLDLSFLGWHILSALTIGILGIFYVAPYEYMTDAALYEELRYGSSTTDGASVTEAAGAVPVPPFAQVDAAESMWDDEADAPVMENKGVDAEDADGAAPAEPEV